MPFPLFLPYVFDFLRFFSASCLAFHGAPPANTALLRWTDSPRRRGERGGAAVTWQRASGPGGRGVLGGETGARRAALAYSQQSVAQRPKPRRKLRRETGSVAAGLAWPRARSTPSRQIACSAASRWARPALCLSTAV